MIFDLSIGIESDNIFFMLHLIIIFFFSVSLPLFSCENAAAPKSVLNMTTEEFIKTNDVSKIANQIIRNFAEGPPLKSHEKERKQFNEYILNEAPERIRLLYAIQIISERSFTQSPSSSGLAEQFNRFYIDIFTHKIALLDEEAKANKK